MVPIYLCSIVALAVSLRKWLELGAVRGMGMEWLDAVLELLREGEVAQARDRCATITHPAARAITSTLGVTARRPDRAEAEAGRAGSLEVQRFEKHLGVLSFIVQAAPLLGLFGTVIGLVDLFIDLERSPRAAMDVSVLSSGIWTALITTAAGLAVALLALGAHSVLAARADELRLLMHDAIERVLTAAPRAERTVEAPEQGV